MKYGVKKQKQDPLERSKIPEDHSEWTALTEIKIFFVTVTVPDPSPPSFIIFPLA